MLTADQAYGAVPVANPSLAAGVPQAASRMGGTPATSAHTGRKGQGETATMTGDPVLTWVILLGVALLLGKVNATISVG